MLHSVCDGRTLSTITKQNRAKFVQQFTKLNDLILIELILRLKLANAI